MRKWFEPEIDFLTRNWELYTAKEIGEILKFSEGSVSSMASKLGLKKSKDFKKRSLQRMSLEKKMSFHDRYILECLKDDWHGINYTTRATSLGGAAEEYFHQLVPEAIDANRDIKINNPDFDFIYKDLTIDVKYSSAHKRKETYSHHWGLRCTGNMDIIVAFLEREQGMELEDPYIIVIPKGVFAKKRIEIHKEGRYGQMFIEDYELQQTLDKYQNLKELLKNKMEKSDE